ncbi:MAG: bifunctional tetrahydrofolate synthase/dihydrofolate synthase [Colwellia sp.]|nr:bifunctional tetrahydrofolate synthase/dihydrofolate synthase [Colwellia sp.]MCW9082310.1 bifunctional tetrahydrofolate synthase/dihydrofolate synthase [Colwellia sp.]
MSQHFKSHSKGCRSLNEWLCYLETIHNTEIDLGLSRLSKVANRLTIDFSFATVITVAGTNGKGTTCAFLENALLKESSCKGQSSSSGLTVAVYSSPHIERFNERLRINRADVDDQAFINAFEQVEQARGEISLSYYEFTTLAAFLVLMAVKPNVIILEVGLGGRLDATNIIDADVAVITTVDLDHQAFLGNDRETIGFEKAGIMRAGQDIIIGDTCPPDSVVNHAQQVNNALTLANKKQALAKIKTREQDFTLIEINSNKSEQMPAASDVGLWQWQCKDEEITGGIYCIDNLQSTYIPRDNVATALMVLKQLGVTLTSSKVNELIKQTRVAGRTELFEHDCDVMLDVGHNPHAGRYLAKQLNELKKQKGYSKIVAVTAMLADKDIKNTLLPLSQQIDSWYIAPLAVPRAATTQLMTETLKGFTNSINCFDNITQAFKIASQDAKSTDLILVFGSFYTVAEIRKLLA